AGLLQRGPRAVRAGLLSLPRLLSRLARRDDALGLLRFARDGLLARLFSGSQFAIVRLHAVQLFFLRAHVSDRHAAGHLGPDRRGPAAEIPGLLSGRRVLGESPRTGTC